MGSDEVRAFCAPQRLFRHSTAAPRDAPSTTNVYQINSNAAKEANRRLPLRYAAPPRRIQNWPAVSPHQRLAKVFGIMHRCPYRGMKFGIAPSPSPGNGHASKASEPKSRPSGMNSSTFSGFLGGPWRALRSRSREFRGDTGTLTCSGRKWHWSSTKVSAQTSARPSRKRFATSRIS